MKTYFDSTCPRCGFRSSVTGVSLEEAVKISTIHVCADGEAVRSGWPMERIVLGPGEQGRDKEEA